MPLIHAFMRNEEQRIADEFATNGFVVLPVDDRGALDELRQFIVQLVCGHLQIQLPNDVDDFLNHIERVVPIDKLNDLRLNTYRKMNAASWFRPTYYGLARSTIDALVGNELAMQNRVNLSIQLPRDDSSLLTIHADAFGGETPFQVVEWLPLVDCYNTKSMFFLPRDKSEAIYANFTRYEGRGMDSLYKDVEKDVIWCNVPYGHVLVFSPNYLHGGVINAESETRWSMNCRFTGLFTPYTGAEKKLGSYYLPITTRPVTKMALKYREPAGFKE
jgi:sporadic carbohydrate cluster 2OG-Fe(II) oxygenase